MKPKDYIIRGLKHGYRMITRKKFLNPECNCDRQSSNDIIYEILLKGEPCMIARFGTTEINCINNYLCVKSDKPYLQKVWNYISDKTHTPWWNTDHFQFMNIYSGIFPPCVDTAERFSERYLQDIQLIDILACHQYYEKFMPLRDDIQKIQIEMLYPFFVEKPWTRILKGKKVLVIHPFEDSIREQYKKKELLFEHPEILPDFELITFKPVQSVAGTKVPYADWFEALAHMEQVVSKVNFDIAIIGCGAYGLPLAAYIKRMGKQAIHLAGGTQLLFGILGKRWIERHGDNGIWNYYPHISIDIDYRLLFNKNWCFPSEDEKPQDAQKVENACYW